MVKKTEQSHPGRNKNPGIKPNVSQCFKAERERKSISKRENDEANVENLQNSKSSKGYTRA